MKKNNSPDNNSHSGIPGQPISEIPKITSPDYSTISTIQKETSVCFQANPIKTNDVSQNKRGFSPDEEFELSKLSYKENALLILEYNQAVEDDDLELINKIKWKIVVANIALIRFIAKPIYKRYQCRENGIEFDDLMCAGYNGIRRAIKTYDPDKGSLGTYSGCWISCYTTRYVQDTIRTMRLPNHMHDKIQQIRQAEDFFLVREMINPGDKAIANRLGWEEKEVAEVRKAIQCPTSIDSRGGSEEDAHSLHHYFADKSSPDPENTAVVESQRQFIRLLIEDSAKREGALNKKEKVVLKLRFGINGKREKILLKIRTPGEQPCFRELDVVYNGRVKTLKQLGEFFGTSRERMRQIELNALMKFRKLYFNKSIKNIHPSQITTEELEIIKSIHQKKPSPASLNASEVFKTLRNKPFS